MTYQKSSPREAAPHGDGRGAFGFGRPAHGSDPHASYGFPQARPPVIPSTVVGDAGLTNRCASATVSVKDLQFEVSAEDQENAHIKITAASTDGVIRLDLTFPLESQEGLVGSTLTQAQACVVSFLESVLAELKTKPLQLE